LKSEIARSIEGMNAGVPSDKPCPLISMAKKSYPEFAN